MISKTCEENALPDINSWFLCCYLRILHLVSALSLTSGKFREFFIGLDTSIYIGSLKLLLWLWQYKKNSRGAENGLGVVGSPLSISWSRDWVFGFLWAEAWGRCGLYYEAGCEVRTNLRRFLNFPQRCNWRDGDDTWRWCCWGLIQEDLRNFARWSINDSIVICVCLVVSLLELDRLFSQFYPWSLLNSCWILATNCDTFLWYWH